MNRAVRLAMTAAASSLAVMAFAAFLPEGLPLGIAVRGLVAGGSVALVAVGMVLAHRASGVVNLAQAQLGVVGAVLAVELRMAWDVPYPVALIAGLLTAAAAGALVEVLVLRRLRSAPAVVPMVATVGAAQLLTGLALLLDGAVRAPLGSRFAPPVDVDVVVSPVVIDGTGLSILIAAPAAVLGVAHLLYRTDSGLAFRAIASNRERAALAGVPILGHAAAAWAIAGALSGLALVLEAPVAGSPGATAIAGGGAALLVRALAAAAAGGFTRLVPTVAAAASIGVVEEGLAWSYPTTAVVDVLLVVAIVAVLATRRGVLGRSGTSALAGWRAAVSAPSTALSVPAGRAAWVLVFVAAGAVPLVLDAARTELAALIVIQAIVVLSLVVVSGWAGELSLGQFAVAGAGGATCALLYGRHGWDLMAALPAAAAAGAAVLVALGLPGLRRSALVTAVTTLAFAAASHGFLLEHRHAPWFVEDRIARPALWDRIPLERPWQLYLVALAVLAAVTAAVVNLRRTRAGRALLAVRDNEASASATGIDPVRARLFGLAFSGAVAGVGGALLVLHQAGVHAPSFTPELSLRMLAVAVVGGLGSVRGALLATAALGTADLLLAPEWSLVSTGAGMLVVLLFLPAGVDGVLQRLASAVAGLSARPARVDTDPRLPVAP